MPHVFAELVLNPAASIAARMTNRLSRRGTSTAHGSVVAPDMGSRAFPHSANAFGEEEKGVFFLMTRSACVVTVSMLILNYEQTTQTTLARTR